MLFNLQVRRGKRFCNCCIFHFFSLWRDLHWHYGRNQCNQHILFRILLLGNPVAVNVLKYTSGCGTFPIASLLVRTFGYSIVVEILLPRDSTSFSQSRYESKIPRGTRRSYKTFVTKHKCFVSKVCSTSWHQNVPGNTDIARFGLIKRFFFVMRT